MSFLLKTDEQLNEQENDLYRLRVYTEALKLVGPLYEDIQAGKKKGVKISVPTQDNEFTEHVITVANEIAAIWEANVVEVETVKPVEASTGMPGLPSPIRESSWREGYTEFGMFKIAPYREQ